MAPTLAIRNQWIQRFCDLFLNVQIKPKWISRDIKNPLFLTVVTYQSLHAAFNSEEGIKESISDIKPSESEVISKLKNIGVRTIVVDEAHHLKNAWWESLIKVKDILTPTIVGLTAPPPYDVSYQEWERYLDLNGPVDAEISVPELVVAGNLCPHQDYVFLSFPGAAEAEKIYRHRKNIEGVFNYLKTNEALPNALSRHPLFTNPEIHLEWIYSNIEYYAALLIYLNTKGHFIPEGHLKIIGAKTFELPELSYQWAEELLRFYLYRDFEIDKDVLLKESLTNKLRQAGILERTKISLTDSEKTSKYLTSSISKLNSIKSIFKSESDHLGADLRMVILCDYIRKEYLVKSPTNNMELNKIGVLPVFEMIRRGFGSDLKMAVLTGSLIIIPKSAYEAFQDKAAKAGVISVYATTLPYDDLYFQIEASPQLKHELVHIITQVFEEGYVNIIVGTKSLLGEGWDAPCINSLILASFVGSYVLSNQMRGRAIRSHETNKEKISNIWHLACVNPYEKDGGGDLKVLSRRFKSFVGVNNQENLSIENGLNRLGIPKDLTDKMEIEKFNNMTLSKSILREDLKNKWHTALESGNLLIEEIKIPFESRDQSYPREKRMVYNRTIKYLLATLGSAVGGFIIETLDAFGRFFRNWRSKEEVIIFLMIAGGIGVLLFGRMAIISMRLYISYRDISKDIHGIGNTLLASLINEGVIKSSTEKLKVDTNLDEEGSIFCHLIGGTTFEKSAFINAMEEVVGPINNPRYIIVRKSFFVQLLSQKDYHSVPEVIGRNKRSATFFANKWKSLVGDNALIYTRTIDGRKLVLKSRVESLASQFQEKAERINKWR